MNFSMTKCILVITLLLVAAAGQAATPNNLKEVTEGEKLFALKVASVLKEKCLGCHGEDPDEIQGDLNMLTLAGLLQGGETSDQVLVPGDADASLIMRAVKWEDPDFEMPPKENDRLTEEQIEALHDWINAGAPWLSEERVVEVNDFFAEGEKIVTSEGLSGEWTNRRYQAENLWAYRPLQYPAVPWEFVGGDVSANPIDAFINRKLVEAELEPAPPADRRTWIRRATYDLTGLPPSPEDIARFLLGADSDESSRPFASVVDRLLASPHYGEQWGRHWLDVVRYADSAGYANDYPRPNAWRYRDYVIRSFNADKPYTQFIREQLAGDEINPSDPEMLIATGFLRMGAWEHTGMSVAKITRALFLDDITDSIGQVFLSHPLSCARCHDHKFDPIPTRDYYRLQAVFSTTQFADRDAVFLSEESREGFQQENQAVQKRLVRNQLKIAGYKKQVERATERWCQERGIETMTRGQMRSKGVPEKDIPPRDLGLSYADLGRFKAAQKAVTLLRLKQDACNPIALSVYNGFTRVVNSNRGRINMPKDPMTEGEMEETCIRTGGDPFAQGAPVTPGVLSMLPGSNDTLEPTEWNTIPRQLSGRRLALANWIADSRNVLTARVMVNRIWQYHFGKGIVGTTNNFGAMGKKPTHPELLDWLANQFIQSEWSIKEMHRLIMNSDAYRRASEHPARKVVEEKDPSRQLYAHFQPRRLSAEEFRDSMLFASGELNPEMGGIPIKPEINLEAALQPRHIMGGFAPAYQPSPTRKQRNRRTIYAVKIRGLRDPFMEVFNQPSPEKSCAKRDASTVTPQVFSLINALSSYDRAIAMALRLEKETTSVDRAVDRAFFLTYGRRPKPEESVESVAYIEKMRAYHMQVEFEPHAYPKHVIREGFEEMTGEPFTFSEKLDVYEDYEPDMKLADVGPETRALMDFCLVLFNSNEFAYVY